MKMVDCLVVSLTSEAEPGIICPRSEDLMRESTAERYVGLINELNLSVKQIDRIHEILGDVQQRLERYVNLCTKNQGLLPDGHDTANLVTALLIYAELGYVLDPQQGGLLHQQSSKKPIMTAAVCADGSVTAISNRRKRCLSLLSFLRLPPMLMEMMSDYTLRNGDRISHIMETLHDSWLVMQDLWCQAGIELKSALIAGCSYIFRRHI